MDIETQLAQASKTRVERRDPQANYHKMGPAELRALTPDFSWDTYFRNIGFADIRDVNVGQPEFFQALDKQLTSVPLADWKVYLRWHVHSFSRRGALLEIRGREFQFLRPSTLTGAKEIQPRWKRCVASTDRSLGEALGQKYVEQAFPPEAKARANQMVQNLVAALRADIEALPWMSDPTRKQALAKLAAMSLKIGYPDKWRDYSAYQVNRGPYVENTRARQRIRVSPRARADRQAGGPQRVGHDAADRQCLLRSQHERDRFSRGHSAAAVFRCRRPTTLSTTAASAP